MLIFWMIYFEKIQKFTPVNKKKLEPNNYLGMRNK